MIGDVPHQPRSFNFPHRGFGKKNVVKRKFQPLWFGSWPWLHYQEDVDKVFCFQCVEAYQLNQLKCSTLEPAFISTDYGNWKDATAKKAGFSAHEKSDCHHEAVQRVVTLPATTKDVGESLSEAHEGEKVIARQNLLKILSNLRFLARQTQALRDHGDEEDSNFTQLIYLRAEQDPSLLE